MDFIKTYFTEEKSESVIFVILGVCAILLALFFWLIIKYSLFNGIAYPFLLIGIIQVLVGTTILTRTPKDIERVENIVAHDPIKIKTEELPRMEKVARDFKIYKATELILLALGLVLYFYFFNSKLPFWKGLGLGLLIQSAIMLALDLLAADRAAKYIDELQKILP